jgi:sporulation protein YlmC with PRC-barrel domain
MKKYALLGTVPLLVLVCGIAVAAPKEQLAQESAPSAPVAGQIPLGVTVIQMRAIVAGWSVKRDVLGKNVQNDRKENLGKIEDLIVTPQDQAAFAIIGVGGFLGIAERLVAIPTQRLKIVGDHFLLNGATKENLQAMPPFVYAH